MKVLEHHANSIKYLSTDYLYRERNRLMNKIENSKNFYTKLGYECYFQLILKELYNRED